MPTDSASDALPTLPFFVVRARLRCAITRTSAKVAPRRAAMFKAQLAMCFMAQVKSAEYVDSIFAIYGVARAASNAFFIASNSFSIPRSLVDSSALAPSDFASFGLSWTSMNTPSTPAATAARANKGMNSGCPPLTAGPLPSDCDEGNCTEWVASKTTGANLRMMASDRISTTRLLISETRSALGQEDLSVARVAAFLHRVPHVPRRIELSLLDVHRPSAERGGHHQIGLPAEKRRNLQNIRDFGDFAYVCRLVHIGQHRHLEFILNLLQNAQAFL